MKPLTAFIFGLSLLATATLQASNFYIYFDAGCMKRLEYVYPNTQPGQEYVVYTLPLANGTQLMLEVGIESQGVIWRSVPGNPILCGSGDRSHLNASMAEAVNDKKHEVYMVFPAGTGQYRITRVKFAAVNRVEEDALELTSLQYRIYFNKNLMSSAVDVSGDHPRGKVYYSQKLPYGNCSAHVFRQNLPSGKLLEIIVVPGLGVVEERGGNFNNFKLKSVNATDAAVALNAICEKSSLPPVNEEFTSRGLSTYSTNLSSSVVAPDSRRNIRRQHQVESGESMYGIAKRYHVNFNDFLSWNSLQENTVIYPGMNLYVEGPAVVSEQPIQLMEFGIKGQESTENGNFWMNAPDVYTVQKGETAASIARKLGYTEARFRFFNNLPVSMELREGDKVKTRDCSVASSFSANQVSAPEAKYSTLYEDPYGVVVPTSTHSVNNTSGNPNGEKGSEQIQNPLNAYAMPVNAPAVQTPVNRASEEVRRNPQPSSPQGAPVNTTDGTLYPKSGQNAGSASAEFKWNTPSNGTTSSKTPTVQRRHIVRNGETLASIAKRYGMTEAQLRELNEMGPAETVIEFQTIRVY